MPSVTENPVREERCEVHVALALQAPTHMIGAKICNALKCRVILPDMSDRLQKPRAMRVRRYSNIPTATLQH